MVHKIILEELDVDVYETKIHALVSWRIKELISAYPMVPEDDRNSLLKI
jgi:hypothetical protein